MVQTMAMVFYLSSQLELWLELGNSMDWVLIPWRPRYLMLLIKEGEKTLLEKQATDWKVGKFFKRTHHTLYRF